MSISPRARRSSRIRRTSPSGRSRSPCPACPARQARPLVLATRANTAQISRPQNTIMPAHMSATSQKGQPPPYQNIITTISSPMPPRPGLAPARPGSAAIPLGGKGRTAPGRPAMDPGPPPRHSAMIINVAIWFGRGRVRPGRAAAWLARRSAVLLLALTVSGLAVGLGLHLAGVAGAGDAAWAAVGVCGAGYALWAMGEALARRRVGVDVIALLALAGALAVGELLAAAVISVMLASGRALEAWAA